MSIQLFSPSEQDLIQTKANIRAFMSGATIEASCMMKFNTIVANLDKKGITIPQGMTISIVDKSTDATSKDQNRVLTIAQAEDLVKRGYSPMPHLAAARIEDENHLKSIVEPLVDLGVKEILLLAGDPKTPVGKYRTAMDLARTGLLDRKEIVAVRFAGHPYGNPNGTRKNVHAELVAKNGYAQEHPEKDVSLISQVCYTPLIFNHWIRSMRNEGIDMPVRAGILLGNFPIKLAFAKTTFIHTPQPGEEKEFLTKLFGKASGIILSRVPAEMKLDPKEGKDLSEAMLADMVNVAKAMGLQKAATIALSHATPSATRDMINEIPSEFIVNASKGAADGTNRVLAPHFYAGRGVDFERAMEVQQNLVAGRFAVTPSNKSFILDHQSPN